MMDTLNVSNVLRRLGPLSSSITFLQLYRLLSITRRILPEISNRTQSLSTEQVERLELPVHITRFLVEATGIPTASVKRCWESFRNVLISCDEELYEICEDDIFRLHGTSYKIGECIYVSVAGGGKQDRVDGGEKGTSGISLNHWRRPRIFVYQEVDERVIPASITAWKSAAC